MVTLLLTILTLAGGPEQGILVMAHGGDEAWNNDVRKVVRPLEDRFPTEIAFGMARTSTIRTAVARLEEKGVRRVAVVRMFISGESFLPETEYILGLRDSLPEGAGLSMPAGHHGAAKEHGGSHDHASQHDHSDHHADHGADHPEHAGAHHMEPPEPITTECTFILSRQGMAESPLVEAILADRIRKLSTKPEIESVLLLAHGPADDEENARWLAHMEQRAQPLRALGPFRDVRCLTLREDWPDKRAEAEQRIRAYVQEAARNDGRCIVVPFRVSGFGPYAEALSGLDYVADKQGFCPHPNVTKWIEQTAQKCFSRAE